MNKKYLKFSLEKLLEDKEFVFWALYDIHKNEWNSFLKEHPDFSNKAQKGKEIVLLLKDKYDKLDKEDILTMWQNIGQFYSQQLSPEKKILRLSTIFKYAAILILIISISGIGYMNFRNKNSKYYFAKVEVINQNNSQLVLSNGQAIDLKKKESSVHVDAIDGVININNDSVIPLPKSTKSKVVFKYNEVVVPNGKKSVIELEDGTKIWLNAGSRLAFPSHFNGNIREVFLEGEAYFVVAHNETKPFLVNADEVCVKVLGTRFDISAYKGDEDILTVLEEGKVMISRKRILSLAEKETVMTQNQKAIFNKELKTFIVKDEPNVEFYTAWAEGWLPFSKESLFDVFNKLQRYYNVKFIYNRSFPSDDLISGKLDLKDSISQVLVTLSNLAKISYKIENENIYIETKLK